MRSPSNRILRNRVDIYRVVRTQDADAGTLPTYPTALATSVPCSTQPDLPTREFDDAANRIVEKTNWDVMFATNYSLTADDKIVFVDDASITRNLYVRGSADQAGRGGAFVVSCEERT